jgi:MFS family permease
MTAAEALHSKPSARVSWATWAIAFCCDSYSELFQIVTPLWALYLGYSPFEIGVLVAARASLPLVLIIHGGALVDRFGTKQMLVTLAAVSALNPLLFPILPWFPALILLQMVGGLAGSLAWVAAQALALQVSNADTTFISRFAFSARFGTTFAPAVIGFMWDRSGIWLSFFAIALWGSVFLVGAILIPDTAIAQQTKQIQRKITLRSLMPNLSDYIGAFRLFVIPSVVFVVAVSFVRVCSSNIQSSFYIVYLKEISFPGTMIGTLITISSVSAGIGTLMAGPMEKLFPAKWMYLSAVTLSVIFITATPVLGSWFPVLAAVIALRGFFQGLSGPIMFTYLSRSVKPSEQGLSIGLRSTFNRLSVLIMPLVMGATADIFSVSTSFYVMGTIFLVILGAIAVWARDRGSMD